MRWRSDPQASQLGRKDTLEGKLLPSNSIPASRVARVSVPHELTPYEQSVVENRMAKLFTAGSSTLVGASGSAKDGKFYFVDLAHSKQIAERFQHWPEAAIVYFSILVSDCKLMVDEPNFRIVVVQDHALGTNDCRGWVRESSTASSRSAPSVLPVPAGIRCARTEAGKRRTEGDERSRGRQACGRSHSARKRLQTGIERRKRFLPQLGTSGRLYTGPAVLGIKQISRHWSLDRATRWSSTLRKRPST
jgi:hypothetical protein